ncbi:hypothetical protein R9X47_04485 [Wukongibacter baidiensis]
MKVVALPIEIILIILGTKTLIIERNLVLGLACYIFVIAILGWIMNIKFL